MQAVEGLADVARRFEEIRARCGFKPTLPQSKAKRIED